MMSRSIRSTQNNATLKVQSPIVVPNAKQPRLNAESTQGEKTQSTSDAAVSSLPHPHPEKTAEATTTSEAPATTSRAPRDPHGHKLIKVTDALDSAHKVKYLPLGDGQFTYCIYFQPIAMKECGKYWCEVEMLELINGTNFAKATRVYSVDGEDLLKMCYLHAMANRDIQGEPRLHFEQWVLSVFQDYCASYGNADYTERGAIARYYLEKISYQFKIGAGNGEGEPSHLEMFFQKRCVRDLKAETDERVKEICDNRNVVAGKTGGKSKFEYQIEGYIMCLLNDAETKECCEGETTTN